jgi:hypothetical protein
MVHIGRVCAIGALCAAIAACGTLTPQKEVLHPDTYATVQPDPQDKATYLTSREGILEEHLVANIRCELKNGLSDAMKVQGAGYLQDWGTQITLKLTWDEMSNVSPGISFIQPLASTQSRSLGLGGTASSHSTRLETITFLLKNSALLEDRKLDGENEHCNALTPNYPVASDLKIADFIVDKTTLAGTGVTSTDNEIKSQDPQIKAKGLVHKAARPTYTTFQEELTFVAVLSGNLTPTWKLTRFTANSSGNTLSGTRTTTGDILITLGAVNCDANGVCQLQSGPATQHNALVIGAAVNRN